MFISLRKSRPRLPSIDTLISDIEGLFINGATLTEQALKTFTQAVGTNLEERFAEYGQIRQPYLRLSNVGKPLRQLWFEINGANHGLTAEPLPPAALLKFLYGDILEDFLILLAIEAGHEVTDLQRKVDVDGVRGLIDCLIDGVLVDVKSASTFSFNKFKSGAIRTDDPFGYIHQLAGYSCALELDAAFLVVDKTLGHLCLARFSNEELASYDVRERIRVVREALASDDLPDCCCVPVADGKSGNLKLPVQGSYCGWKRHCYPDLRVFAYSNGPTYLTHVALEPRVQEVI